LADADYYSEAARQMLADASADLLRMSDEELFLAWLRADRAMMGQQEQISRGVREGLLLCARENRGPAVVFLSGEERVYLLPLDGKPEPTPGATWVQMEAYKDGRLQWTGLLRMAGAMEPERLRLIAARMAQEARDEIAAK
jgi:hypothetical protein